MQYVTSIHRFGGQSGINNRGGVLFCCILCKVCDLAHQILAGYDIKHHMRYALGRCGSKLPRENHPLHLEEGVKMLSLV